MNTRHTTCVEQRPFKALSAGMAFSLVGDATSNLYLKLDQERYIPLATGRVFDGKLLGIVIPQPHAEVVW